MCPYHMFFSCELRGPTCGTCKRLLDKQKGDEILRVKNVDLSKYGALVEAYVNRTVVKKKK